MTGDDLRAMRKTIGFSQAELAEKLGLSVRGYLKLETGEAHEIRGAYPMAVERLSLSVAVERGDPMLAAPGVRAEAFALVGLVGLVTSPQVVPPPDVKPDTKDDRVAIGGMLVQRRPLDNPTVSVDVAFAGDLKRQAVPKVSKRKH